MAFLSRALLTLGAAAVLAPHGAEATAARWRSYGRNTGCSVAAPDVGSSPAVSQDAAQLHTGVQSLDDCKALCEQASRCRGVEFLSAEAQCRVLTEAISHAHVEADSECARLQEDEVHSEKKVFVMLPLNVVNTNGTLHDSQTLLEQFEAMLDAGVDGFMVDFWWGITEPTPKAYNFAPYRKLVDMATERSWLVQVVSSFHQCGGNVGDKCHITLPSFVYELDGIWYKDAEGRATKEYISLFADEVEIHEGRTPLQMYGDWFEAFAAEFAAELGSTIEEVMVGMGPCGELRYPAYRLKHNGENLWNFCGIGEFQCYDSHALSSLAAAAEKAGHTDWGLPPDSSLVGTYNSRPAETEFFTSGYQTEEGQFFLDWYSSSLKAHGERVLSAAEGVFGGAPRLSAKIAGIHWWYDDPSHAAEVTAGYYNTNSHNAYAELAEMFAQYGATLDFTCLEMRNTEQPTECKSNPEMLVDQAIGAAEKAGIHFGGENALSRFDNWAYNKMLSYKDRLHAITYLRLFPELVEPQNLQRFDRFVRRMHADKGNGDENNGGQRRLAGIDEPGHALQQEFVV